MIDNLYPNLRKDTHFRLCSNKGGKSRLFLLLLVKKRVLHTGFEKA